MSNPSTESLSCRQRFAVLVAVDDQRTETVETETVGFSVVYFVDSVVAPVDRNVAENLCICYQKIIDFKSQGRLCINFFGCVFV